MKKYKVIEESLCNHLMAIARGEPPSSAPQMESIQDVKPDVLEPSPETESKEPISSFEPEVVEEKAPAEMTGGGAAKEITQPCDCVMHQTGLGIKRTTPEDWLSFDKFVEKKKQQPKHQRRRKKVSTKKKKKVQHKRKTKCTKRRR